MLPNHVPAATEEIHVLLRMLARQRQAYENELLEREATAKKRQQDSGYSAPPTAYGSMKIEKVVTLLHRNIYYMLRLHKQLERLEKSTPEKSIPDKAKPVISPPEPKRTADGKIMPDKKDWFNQRAWEKLNP